MRIKTQDLVILRMLWPTPSKDLDTKELKHFKKTLAAARRCVHEKAPITLAETGFQLLKKVDEAELVECLDLCLAEIDMESGELLVMLSAPECDEYGEYYYAQSAKLWLDKLADMVADIAERAKTKAPRVDTFHAVFKHLDILTGIVQDTRLIKIHQYLVKLEDWDYTDDKDKGVRLLNKLAGTIREVEL